MRWVLCQRFSIVKKCDEYEPSLMQFLALTPLNLVLFRDFETVDEDMVPEAAAVIICPSV